ncbi:hypothetical protein OHU17_00785 [Streptomyces goshikiensis]|uniref:Uncharacterized protein n=1 Tax=Streptomyces goshikiensis TaxID=1942 RepID=A0ABZ1RE48_9ACTN|nr:hypothetical protein [Streptomyces goshikiensis]
MLVFLHSRGAPRAASERDSDAQHHTDTPNVTYTPDLTGAPHLTSPWQT